MPSDPTPRFEIRIATVMYGGTSLAVYMNGVAQELLQLVRATSPHALPGQEGSGTARVYRKLARLLEARMDSGVVPPPGALEPERAEDPPPGVRFVVDVLSGSSAGGINAVMLAKALVRNADLRPVRELWLSEAGIESLINDRTSAKERYPYREPVQALFSSDRMYTELHQALKRLRSPGGQAAEPLVEQLDLAVTATDLDGDPVKLRLADRVVDEFEHRHSFDFVYDGRRDMFDEAHDDRLAFAARTTSSLPAVFEPSTVAEARRLAGEDGEDDEAFFRRWQGLFRGTTERERRATMRHAFADGGYLDNKPFGHAIDKLAGRSSASRVVRKLFYIEPLPRDIDPLRRQQPAPDALGNTLAVVSLARHEPIRQDVRRLSERNRTIDRLRTLHFGVTEDLAKPSSRRGLRQALRRDSLQEAVEGRAFGAAYGAYHRLRVSVTTDRLAQLLGDHLGVAEDSDERQALRWVVSAWRNRRYARSPGRQAADGSAAGQPPQDSEAAFLEAFDLGFAERRARFLLGKINQLAWLDEHALPELRHLAQRFPGSELARLVALADSDRPRAQRRWWELEGLMLHARRHVRQALEILAAAPSAALREDGGPEQGAGLLAILRQPTARGRTQATADFLRDHGGTVEALLERIARSHADHLLRSAQALEAMRETPPDADILPRTMARVLRAYLDDFPAYDLAQFPILEASGIGEELAPVEIHRIGGSDADGLLPAEQGRHKLFGARFATFGAFFDRRWRENDLLWGRLDGADRLIRSLLPPETDPAVHRALFAEAAQTIMAEAFAGDPMWEDVQALCARHADDPDAVITALRRFVEHHQADMELRLPEAARSASRLLRTTGKLLDGMVTRRGMPQGLRHALAWPVMLGGRLAEVAVPQGLGSLLAGHAMNLALLVSVVLLGLGWWLGQGVMTRTGAIGLAVVVGAKALIGGLQTALAGRSGRAQRRTADPAGRGLAPVWLGFSALVLAANLLRPLLPPASAVGAAVHAPLGQLLLDLALVVVYTGTLLPLGRLLLRRLRWEGGVVLGLTTTAAVLGVGKAVGAYLLEGRTGLADPAAADLLWPLLGLPAAAETLALHLAVLLSLRAFLLPHPRRGAGHLRLGHLLLLTALALVLLGTFGPWLQPLWSQAAAWLMALTLLGMQSFLLGWPRRPGG